MLVSKMPMPEYKRTKSTADWSSGEEQGLSLSEKLRMDIVKQLDRYTDAMNLEAETRATSVSELQDEVLGLQWELSVANEKVRKCETLCLDTEGLLDENALRSSIDVDKTEGFSRAEMTQVIQALLRALREYEQDQHKDIQKIPDAFATAVQGRYVMFCGFGLKMRLAAGWTDRMNMNFPTRNNFRITIFKP
ncbi:unnamed protein product [Amoebophrya sp. A120]|nr:unnamed protein product [Amoebophrya sp. A120]|eukprot:GSA120T00005647001.1